ncbi:MAG: hypothetical protein HUU16_00690 [Candidatus Omnitrophica bacterium]|nr:hypothetical protein [bacterium]NUN94666.1 hypothetical protein [Candidatus Omnitrophota bacterium]
MSRVGPLLAGALVLFAGSASGAPEFEEMLPVFPKRAIAVETSTPSLETDLLELEPRRPSLLDEDIPRLVASKWEKPFDPNVPDFEPMPNRWDIQPPPYEKNDRSFGCLDPYHQNKLKGDFPFLGDDYFHVLTVTSQSLFESREVPIPSGVSAQDPGSFDFFGEDRQDVFVENLRISIDIYKGQTSFRPPDWRLRYTHVFNYNDIASQELGVVSPDVRRGRHRDRRDNSIEELFFELLLEGRPPKYDFTSARIGIQPFVSDFRGFVFNDTNLGYRLFGSRDNNKLQWNLAWFDQLEKETNSELNTFESRGQQVFVANVYRQDFLWLGYTGQLSFHANWDDPSVKYDKNGFLVRPDPIGSFQRHEIDAYYFGWAGEGHIGELNISHQFYQVCGEDELNPIAGTKQEIDAQLFALELSIDRDWFRPKASFLYQSGDKNPLDSRAKGFDGILENPNFAGGPFSYWGRQALRLSGTAVGLVQRNSPYSDLTTSKIQGQSNHVNPGLFLYNAGFDIDWTPRLKTLFNASYLRFDHTEPIELALQQPGIDEEIGWDLSLGFQYRPYFTNNVIFTGGVSTLITGDGFEEISTKGSLYAGFLEVAVTF